MKMKKGYHELVWAVSGLTELIGQGISCSSDEGRSFHWDFLDDEGYWLSLYMKKGTDEIYAEIQDTDHKHIKEMYAVIGFCQYQGIRHVGVGQHD